LVFGAGNFDKEEGLPTIKSFGKIKENERLADIYAACDVFVVPSLYEAFGQTAIEAMSCGTPVVAFNTGGLKDSVIPNQTGLLAERGNPNDLANKIGELLANPEARVVMGKKARVLVEEKFNFELQSTRYASLYNSIL
jgi:glycosyltransferase involved in cell wall biosynthesis